MKGHTPWPFMSFSKASNHLALTSSDHSGSCDGNFGAKSLRHRHFGRGECGKTEDIRWFEIPREALKRSLGGRGRVPTR